MGEFFKKNFAWIILVGILVLVALRVVGVV